MGMDNKKFMCGEVEAEMIHNTDGSITIGKIIKKMKYLIVFLMLAIIYVSITGCTKSDRDKYRLKGFFTVKIQNEE
jgi:hypothetical protein